MKKYLVWILFVALLLVARTRKVEESLAGSEGVLTNNPVSVSWIWPTNNTTLSGQVTMSVNAQSLVGPITRVEFYDIFDTTNMYGAVRRWTNLMSVITNSFTTPEAFSVY